LPQKTSTQFIKKLPSWPAARKYHLTYCGHMVGNRAGFTYVLCRLNPRASRSKGPSANCGTHTINYNWYCQYKASPI